MSLKDLIAPFAVWKRALEKPYTVRNPIDQRPGADRYRGFHVNDLEKCIGCGTCEDICQNRAIDLISVEGRECRDGDSGLRPRIDYGRCCWCALCVDICTTSSLRMSNEYIWVDTDPEVFRFTPGADGKSWDDRQAGYTRAEGYSLLNPDRASMEMLDGERSVEGFLEIVKGYSAEQARAEADRCVECGICVATCPAHMDIPGYIRAVRENDLTEGLRLLYATNPFPASCGRICTHRCEEVCALGHTGDPIAIRWLKRYIADQFELGEYGGVLPRVSEETGKRVAVVGAGPGGLSAAYYLRLLGYAVTVYERLPKGGGMLRYGIPEYRLPYDQLDKDIEYVASLGAEIEYGVEIDAIRFAEILDSVDAVFLSTGLPEPYRMGIDGEDHPRVVSGLSILKDVTEGKTPNLGDSVAVIGGGNVAMDAARTARRFGARVTIIYRRREQDMPADVEELEEAKAEEIEIITQAIPQRIEETREGRPVFVWGKARMEDPGDGTRPRPVLIEGSEERFECDTIVSAIGQGPDLRLIPEDSGVEIRRYKVVTDAKGRTGSAKVFAGGDIANSLRDAVSAVGDGHWAARGIDEFLRGERGGDRD